MIYVRIFLPLFFLAGLQACSHSHDNAHSCGNEKGKCSCSSHEGKEHSCDHKDGETCGGDTCALPKDGMKKTDKKAAPKK